MSFDTLKKEDLLKIAEDYGVDVKASDTKAIIIAAFAEDGVTWADVAKMDETVAQKDAELKDEPVDDSSAGEKQLLRMLRANGTYEVRGYKFTKEHPFVLVAAEDAEFITENDPGGFRYATPKEAQAYYK